MKNLFSLFALFFSIHLIQAENYYVSPNGLDNNLGTSPQEAFHNLSALSVLNLNPGDSILLESSGVYEGTITINFSGSENLPIVISSYGEGAKPILTGSEKLKLSSSGTVYCPDCDIYDNMVLNESEILIPARYPNEGYIDMLSVSGNESFGFSDAFINSELSSALVVARTEGWVIDRFPIENISGSQINVGESLGFHEAYDFQVFNGFFLTHHHDFLDSDNEWFFDTATDTLYVFDTTLDSLTVSMYDDGIEIATGVSDVIIQNLEIKNYRKDGISLNNNSIITISNCDFENLGNDGIGGVKSWSTDNRKIHVENCTFNNILNTAINLFFGSEAYIAHNKASKIGLIPGEGMMHDVGYTGIAASDDALVEWNQLDSVGYIGLTFGSGKNWEARYNQISEFGLTKNDCGGIYCWDGHNGHVHHNYIYNGYGIGAGTKAIDGVMNVGVYIDDQSSNILVEYNTINNCYEGMMIHNASNNTVRKNVFYDNRKTQLTILEGHPHYGDVVKGNVVEENSFQAVFPGSSLIELYSNVADVNTFSVFNNNIYNHPYNSNPFVLEYVEVKTPTYDLRYEALTFNAWKNRMKLDLYSYGTFDTGQKYGEKTLGDNLILNSTFDNGTGWWWSYGNDQFTFESRSYPSFEGKALKAEYASSEFSASHLGTSNFSLENDQDYILSFSILGEESGSLKLQIVESEEPHRKINTSDFPGCSFTTEKQEKEIVFSVGKSTPVSLTFNSSSYDGNYYLDDVELRPLDYDTSQTQPRSYTKLFLNLSEETLELGKPEGYILQSGYEIKEAITLEPYTSVVLKKSDNPISAVYENETTESVFFYPNPVNEFIYLNVDNTSGVEIISINGKPINVKYFGDNKIDVRSLKSGLYLIKLNQQNGAATQKFLKL